MTFALTAQPPAGEIRILIKDASGAGMRAEGRVRGPSVNRVFQTDASGSAAISRLPLGSYRLEVSQAGFARQSLTIAVQSAEPVVRTITLAVAQSRTALDVVAATPLPGMDLEASQIPALVQTVTNGDIEKSGANGLEDFLNSERERYAAQLDAYADAVGGARRGLYFASLRGWREW